MSLVRLIELGINERPYLYLSVNKKMKTAEKGEKVYNTRTYRRR